jgi:hypothetical protein
VKMNKPSKNLYRIGRPTKRPSQDELTKLGHLTLVLDDVRSILKKSRQHYPTMDDKLKSLKISVVKGKDGKPKVESNWQPYTPESIGDRELGLILEVLTCPTMIDATRKSKTKIERAMLPIYAEKAIQWAKLFADAPGMMIDALPKIKKRIGKLVGNPRQRVIHHYCLMNEMQRFYGPNDFCDRFWTAPANVLRDELKQQFPSVSITTKTIEKARESLRKKRR